MKLSKIKTKKVNAKNIQADIEPKYASFYVRDISLIETDKISFIDAFVFNC